VMDEHARQLGVKTPPLWPQVEKRRRELLNETNTRSYVLCPECSFVSCFFHGSALAVENAASNICA